MSILRAITSRRVIIIAAIIATAIAKDADKPESLSDCMAYTQDWQISSCASSLRNQGLVTKFTYNQMLMKAISIGQAPMATYYSIGLVTGANVRLTAAKQFDPAFEKQISLSLNAKDVYTRAMYLDLIHPVDRPILLFLDQLIDGIPELQIRIPHVAQPTGNADTSVRVTRFGPLDLDFTNKEACAEFGKWEYMHSAKSMVGSAIILPGSMWCPNTAKKAFLVMRGTYTVDDHSSLAAKVLLPIKQDATDSRYHFNINGSVF